MADNLLQVLEAQLVESAKRLEGLTRNLPPPVFPPIPQPKKSGLGKILLPLVVGGGLLAALYFNAKDGQKSFDRRQEMRQEIERIEGGNTQNKEIESLLLDFGESKKSIEIDNLNYLGCILENKYDNSNHLRMGAGESYSFTLQFLFPPPSSTKLEVNHLSSSSQGKPGITPVTLYVNQNKVRKWKQLESGYTTSIIPIGSYLRPGKNTVSFKYDSEGGTTYYWQKYVRIKSR